MFSALLGKCGSPSALNPYSGLQSPSIASRCSYLRTCITTLPLKELHQFFPHLLSNIFGFDRCGGWGLRTFNHALHSDFHQVLYFLSPSGELFKLISRLDSEGFLYEFPTTCLPRPSQQSLSEGVVPSFYSNKVQLSLSVDTTPAHVSLSAFEFYFFHFAYFLVSTPVVQIPQAQTNLSDSLYSHLLDSYLSYYLPFSGAVPDLPPLTSSPAQGSPPYSYHHHGSLDATATPPGLVNISSGSSLFSGGMHSPPSQPSTPHGLLKLPTGRQYSATLIGSSGRGSMEATPTEVLIQILVEFWLNQNSYDEGHGDLLVHAQNMFFLNEEHLLFLRRLLKLVHYFTNGITILTTSLPSPLTPLTDTLRCCIVDVFFQKKLYHFLHYNIKHSPLDNNFRFLLEVWLTYIQPWRYLDPSRPSAENKESLEALPERWRAFVLNNFPFYSSLLMEFLSRCMLTSNIVSSVTYLYRTCKVFSQPGLMGFIEYGESLLCNQELISTAKRGSSPVTAACSIKALLVELEGPIFHYMPVFDANTIKAVQSLLIKLCQSKTTLGQTLPPSPASHHPYDPQLSPPSPPPQPTRTRSFWTSFVELFSDDSSHLHTPTTHTNNKKLLALIDHASTNLADMFKISIPKPRPPQGDGSPVLGRAIPVATPSFEPSHAQQTTPPECLTPEYVNGTPLLTPQGKMQLINGVCKTSPMHVQYLGDPVLQPIRSYENATLVRALYRLSCYLNDRFSQQLLSIASSQKLTSRLFLQLLSPPPPTLTPSPLHQQLHTDSPPRTPVDRVSMVTITPSNQPHQQEHLPRIDLRTFGSYFTLVYVGFAVFLVWLFGVPLWAVVLMVILVVFLYCVAGYYHTRHTHRVSRKKVNKQK